MQCRVTAVSTPAALSVQDTGCLYNISSALQHCLTIAAQQARARSMPPRHACKPHVLLSLLVALLTVPGSLCRQYVSRLLQHVHYQCTAWQLGQDSTHWLPCHGPQPQQRWLGTELLSFG